MNSRAFYLWIVRPIVWMALPLLMGSIGCTVGPDYKRPAVAAPPGWGWKLADPRDQTIKADWWEMFQDQRLNELEAQATAANQQIRVAVARVDQSRAAAHLTDSRFFPQISLDPSISAFHTQQNHVPSLLSATSYNVPLDLSYEVDLWGRVRRSFESAQAQAEATVADYYQVLLTLHGDVATDYFLLRQLDAQIALSQQTLELRNKTVDILTERFHTGMVPELDMQRARTEVFQTQTLLIETQRQRVDLQDALAVLCGQASPTFKIEPGPLPEKLPVVPVALPSQLLERRPDVAEAERKMAAANAQIGVAKAAYFPAISITGTAGYSTFHPGALLDWESQLFQIGPAVSFPLINGGRLDSGVDSARADYRASCASYQQQVLVAFKDVSDALVDLDSYNRQVVSESNAVSSAHEAADTSNERYKQGLINYLDVIDAERTELQTQLQAAQISALRLVSTVHLLKALGGGFTQQ